MTHSWGLVGDVAAASQTWVKVGDTIRATDRRILMNPAATVDVTASRQVSVRQSQRRPAKKQMEHHSVQLMFPGDIYVRVYRDLLHYPVV